MNHAEVRSRQIILLASIVGIVSIIFMSNKMGDNGLGYFVAAFESFLLLYMLFVMPISEAVEKLVRLRLSKGQYKNAGRVLNVAMLYAVIIGLICTAIFYSVSRLWFEKILLVPYAVQAMYFIAPIVLISACINALKGYFQGTGTAMPTAVSHIARTLFFITFSLFFSLSFKEYGEKVSGLLRNGDFSGMYVSSGIALGLLSAAILVFLFVMFVYIGAGRRQKSKFSKDTSSKQEKYSELLGAMLRSILPTGLIGLLLIMPNCLGLFFYQRKQEDIYQSIKRYASFGGKYEVWVVLILAAVSLGLVSMVHKITISMKREEYKLVREQIQAGIIWTFISTMGVTVFFTVLGESIMAATYPASFELEGKMFAQGSLIFRAGAFSIFFGMILWETSRKNVLLVNMLVSVVIYIIATILLLNIRDGAVEVLVQGQLAFFVVLGFLNSYAILKGLRIRIDWFREIALPAIASIVVGIMLLLVSKVIIPMLGAGIGVLTCLVVGLLSYVVLILALRCVSEKEFVFMPGGKILLGLGRMLHLL